MRNPIRTFTGKNAQRGTSLWEVMVATAVSGALGVIIVGAIFQLTKTASDGRGQTDVTTYVLTSNRWLTSTSHLLGSAGTSQPVRPLSPGPFCTLRHMAGPIGSLAQVSPLPAGGGVAVSVAVGVAVGGHVGGVAVGRPLGGERGVGVGGGHSAAVAAGVAVGASTQLMTRLSPSTGTVKAFRSK